jgi:hypothetical protein
LQPGSHVQFFGCAPGGKQFVSCRNMPVESCVSALLDANRNLFVGDRIPPDKMLLDELTCQLRFIARLLPVLASFLFLIGFAGNVPNPSRARLHMSGAPARLLHPPTFSRSIADYRKLKEESMRAKTVVITGASAGVGCATAQAFAPRGTPGVGKIVLTIFKDKVREMI